MPPKTAKKVAAKKTAAKKAAAPKKAVSKKAPAKKVAAKKVASKKAKAVAPKKKAVAKKPAVKKTTKKSTAKKAVKTAAKKASDSIIVFPESNNILQLPSVTMTSANNLFCAYRTGSNAIVYRKSTNGGATFGTQLYQGFGNHPVTYGGPAMVGYPGTNILFLFMVGNDPTSLANILPDRIFYKRSMDNGATWDANWTVKSGTTEFRSVSGTWMPNTTQKNVMVTAHDKNGNRYTSLLKDIDFASGPSFWTAWSPSP